MTDMLKDYGNGDRPSNAETTANPVDCKVIRQRQFLEAIEPYQKIKVDMYKLAIPTIICKPGGVAEYKYNFTDEQQRTLDQLDKLIEAARYKYLGA